MDPCFTTRRGALQTCAGALTALSARAKADALA
jgi:hypothetical protein